MEIGFAVEDGEIGKGFGEEGFRPWETIGFRPVPVVDVGSVGSVLHDPSLVTFAVLGHQEKTKNGVFGLKERALVCLAGGFD